MKKTFEFEHTNNGIVYKNEIAFLNAHNEVCYIAECGFEDFHKEDIDCFTLTLNDNEIERGIESGSISTHNSIIEDIKNLCEYYKIPKVRNFMEYMAHTAIEMCDWQCISTWLNELDMEQEYADWCQYRKEEFELYAVTHVKDELSGELLDECYHNELIERLYNFFGADCYLYHSPEDLIDQWDNEPNY